MYGAILGDMIGAPYEFSQAPRDKGFPLFIEGSHFTDDSVMTVAVAEALLDTLGADDQTVSEALMAAMQRWGRCYPNAGYGGRFRHWLVAEQPAPYGSFGNGSAMRVSAAGWLCDSLAETRRLARLSAAVTHNHPEGIKGAEAVASAIFLARQGSTKEAMRAFISETFGYDLSRSCDDIRPTYTFNATCQGTVPEAITAFLEGENFEDVIRTAVTLGGDCDTLTCIAGSIAEAFYGVPPKLVDACRTRLPENMLTVIDRFQAAVQPFHDHTLDGNVVIEQAIEAHRADSTTENLAEILAAIHNRMLADGHVLVPVLADEDERCFHFRTMTIEDGSEWMVLFTSMAAYDRGEPSRVLSNFIDTTLEAGLASDVCGFIINPWHQGFLLSRELMALILRKE